MAKQHGERSNIECIEASGPWPFITHRVHRLADGSLLVWSSRHHRKGLTLPEEAGAVAITETLLRCLWMPSRLNWWIGVIFALGSCLFAIGSVFALAPNLAAAWLIDSSGIGAIYFAGSIPFTTAAYLQLFQAANAGPFPAGHAPSRQRIAVFGWQPREAGWLSCALQFVGTILFNFNTLDAMIPSLTWFEQDLAIWVPDIFGSILFLASGYLAFIETCHAHWLWRPGSVSWWLVSANLWGCVGFLVSAVLSIVLPGSTGGLVTTLAVAFTLQGAVCFLIGSLLMLPETAVEPAA